jgi:DnaJ-class molecular chaperone
MVKSAGAVATIAPSLEHVCKECEGKGERETLQGQHFTCSLCDGTGYILTDEGKQVFEFVQHLVRRMKFRDNHR